MQWIVNRLRGELRVVARGPFPERLMNVCAQNGISFWALEWRDGHTLSMTVRQEDRKQLWKLAERVGCTVETEGSRGLPAFLARFRTRYAFLAGFALSLAAVCILSSFVLTIQVTGNETVPTGVILSELRRLGVRPGAYGPALERRQIAEEALLSLDELSWMSLNLHGTRLEVQVREAVQPPELTQEEGHYHVVSKADGIVTRVETMDGEAAVKEGDTVTEGEILISGTVSMEPPMYSDQPVRYYQTHARGRVEARTWRTLTASIPLTAQVKAYTGEEKSRFTLTVLGYPVEFYQNAGISWPWYDKISTVYQAGLPGGLTLPLSWTVERYRAYEPVQTEVDRTAAQTLLEERLLAQLKEQIGEEGRVVSTYYTARAADSWLEVTLTAECREEIGREVPEAPDAGDSAPEQP